MRLKSKYVIEKPKYTGQKTNIVATDKVDKVVLEYMYVESRF